FVHLVRLWGHQASLGNNSSRFLPVCSDRLVHERGIVAFSFDSCLSSRWRPNPARTALAQSWTDSQLESSKHHWLRRSNLIRALGLCIAIHLVGYTRLFHFRAGASRLARCSEPRYTIRRGWSG